MIKNPELALCLDDLRLETKAAMDRARTLGFRAIDVAAVAGPISPGELSHTGQRHLLKHLSDLGLRLASLRGPAGGAGYADRHSGERRLETMRKIIDLASTLRVPIVSTTLGAPGEASSDDRAARYREMLAILAADADRKGVRVAVETAGVSAADLNQLLREVDCPMLAACCDSGAMLMHGDDPHKVAELLSGRVRLVRARDAVSGSSQAAGFETAYGEGHLDTPRFLASLAEAGFDGDLVLSRTTGDRPIIDLEKARQELEKHLRF